MVDTEEKYAIVLTQADIEYLLDHLESIAETDQKMDKILLKFDESFALDQDGNFIPHP